MANEFKVKKGLIIEGASGGTALDVQGSQGQLFSVTDDLTGSIFAVSDISGVPIFDVNSSGVSYFDGNVGIGTSSVASWAKLLVEGGGIVAKPAGVNGYYSYLRGNWSAADAFELGIAESSTGTQHKLITTSNYHFGTELNLWTSDTKRLVINSSGNVGIGTTSPNEKLQVVGNIQGGIDQASSAFSSSAIFRGQSSTAAYINLIADSASNSGILLGVSNSGVIDSYVAGMLYNNATNTLNVHVNNGNAIVIDSSRQVGIGNTAPTEKLHVVGNARVTGAFYDSNNSPGTAGQVLSSTATGTDWVAASGSTVYTPDIWRVENDQVTANDTRLICDTTQILNGTTGTSAAAAESGAIRLTAGAVYEITYAVTVYVPTGVTTRQVPALYLTQHQTESTEGKIPGSLFSSYLRLPGSNQGGYTSFSNTVYYSAAADTDISLKVVWLDGATKNLFTYSAASIDNTITFRRIA